MQKHIYTTKITGLLVIVMLLSGCAIIGNDRGLGFKLTEVEELFLDISLGESEEELKRHIKNNSKLGIMEINQGKETAIFFTSRENHPDGEVVMQVDLVEDKTVGISYYYEFGFMAREDEDGCRIKSTLKEDGEYMRFDSKEETLKHIHNLE